MDITWGSDAAHKFVTNVGLITSNGPHGYNIMAAEWTHHVSYEPGLIAVNVGPNKATDTNIKKSKEFGINLAAFDQNIVSSISGGSTGKEVDKIKVLKDFGIEFYKAKKIDTLMIKDAALNVECKLIESMKLGDHTMFVGEAVDVFVGDKEPIVYHAGKYWRFGEKIEKPNAEILEKIKKLVEKNRR